MKALVFIEFNNGNIKKSSLEALSSVQSDNISIETCALGKGSDAFVDQLGSWGVTKHHFCNEDSTAQYNPEVYLSFLKQVMALSQANMIVGSSNNVGRDVLPRLAANLDMAFMSDITEMSFGDSLSVKRPLYAGKCSAQVTFTDDSGKILLLRPNQIPVAATKSKVSTESTAVSIGTLSGANETVSIEKGESEKLDLTEADVIVSGGRGLKEAENFKLLHDLAEPLGATVGASRAVVDLGWVPHSLQVGQTGKTVAPTLYFAIGISGAIQHIAGMSGSKNIVAINKDEKAPIFQKATYGIVGDLFEVVPLLTEKLKSIR